MAGPAPKTASLPWHAPMMVALSAMVALVATVPIASMIVGPVRALVDAAPSSGGSTLGLAYTLIGPLAYVLFAATAWAIMKDRAEPTRFVRTMQWAGRGLIPYVVLIAVGLVWSGGPRLPLVAAAAISLPMAVIATIWTSAQSD